MIAIDDIKVANLLFNERDFYEDAYEACQTIVSIKEFTIVTQDSMQMQLLNKIDNLNAINKTKDNINELEVEKLQALIKKEKREKRFILGGASALLLLLLLL